MIKLTCPPSSQCVHELVMAVSMKKLRLYLFVMQVSRCLACDLASAS